MPLNDRQIKNAKPTGTGKKAKLFDGGGLYLEVTPAGGKIFRLKYRIDGKEKTLTIGKYPAVSLSTLWNWNNPKHRLYRPDFPKPFKVSANTTGWLQSEIDGYICKLAENR